MLFSGTDRGKERFITVLLHFALQKIYDREEYAVFEIMKERVEAGEPGNIDTLTASIREFRVDIMNILVEDIEKHYEGFTERFHEAYGKLASNKIGIDYDQIIKFGPDIKSVYLLVANLILREEFAEGDFLYERTDFANSFAYNMELFPQWEAKVIETSRQLIQDDGLLG